MDYQSFLVYFLVCVSVHVGCGRAAIESDQVRHLPGLIKQPHFKHYSGYLKASGGRRFHYWFVESQGNPSEDPLVLWLNGGPGCSSLDGLLSEHGPFLAAHRGLHLKYNPYSWNKVWLVVLAEKVTWLQKALIFCRSLDLRVPKTNKYSVCGLGEGILGHVVFTWIPDILTTLMVANMLYLESPAGVGFSYSTDGNITTGDDQTSLDNLMALREFMYHYPEFSHQEFYITGESYAGIYVPTLAVRLLEEPDINFKGMAVGNAVSDTLIVTNAFIYFAYYHGLFGTELWEDIHEICCHGNISSCNIAKMALVSPECGQMLLKVVDELEGVNRYNIYDECYSGPDYLEGNRVKVPPYDSRLFADLPSNKLKHQALLASGFKVYATGLPCVDARDMTMYLRRQDVRKALHIPHQLPDWQICSNEVEAHYRNEYTTMIGQYRRLLETKKHRILVYNGDVDMVCNFLGDQWFVDSLHLPVIAKRRKWTYKEKDGSIQIAGYIKQFTNLDFVTIKGAGHMVPQDKPVPALEMFTAFLQGTPLP